MAQWYEAAYFTMAFFLYSIFTLWLISVYSLFPFLASREC